jgi:hypothetical protein
MASLLMSHICGQTGSVHETLEIIQKGKSPVWNRFNDTGRVKCCINTVLIYVIILDTLWKWIFLQYCT